jgi:hypothetical protein
LSGLHVAHLKSELVGIGEEKLNVDGLGELVVAENSDKSLENFYES